MSVTREDINDIAKRVAALKGQKAQFWFTSDSNLELQKITIDVMSKLPDLLEAALKGLEAEGRQ